MPKRYLLNDIDRTEEIDSFAEAIGLNAYAPKRYSTVFILELFCRSYIAGNLNPGPIMAEIKFLEGLGPSTGTKPATMFRGEKLSGFWHKHYQEPSIPSIAKNIEHALKNYGLPNLEKKISDFGGKKIFTQEDVKEISKEVFHDNYKKRKDSTKLTGEWIVYSDFNNKKYYLCLSRHNYDDDHTLSLIESAKTDFPFIYNIPKK